MSAWTKSKGKVTTNAEEIAQWIREGQEDERVSVIFGTYQSGHRIAEGTAYIGDNHGSADLR